VAHHSGATFEAKERGYAAELAAFAQERSPVMDALVYADMTTGPACQRLTFEVRIAELLERYPPGHPVHRAISRARPTLAAAVERTARQHRLAPIFTQRIGPRSAAGHPRSSLPASLTWQRIGLWQSDRRPIQVADCRVRHGSDDALTSHVPPQCRQPARRRAEGPPGQSMWNGMPDQAARSPLHATCRDGLPACQQRD
jgi:hypothetical protein